MELNKKNVLFLTRTMKLGGTENVILQLCEILKPQVNKIVVCSCGGVNVEKLQKMGIKHYMIPDIEEKSLKTFLTTYKVISKIVKKRKHYCYTYPPSNGSILCTNNKISVQSTSDLLSAWRIL